jgi:Endonuclease NucS
MLTGSWSASAFPATRLIPPETQGLPGRRELINKDKYTWKDGDLVMVDHNDKIQNRIAIASEDMKQTVYRGRTITYDDALKAMAQFDSEMRATFPPHKWKTYAVEFNGQIYPPKTILRLITGLGIAGGGKPINGRFEDLGFKIITLPGVALSSEENLQDGDETSEAVETALRLEIDLETFLAGNLGQLEKGLKLYEENGLGGQQLNAKPAGIIDLLATDANGDLVIIELKAGEADRQVCGQITAYMGWVKKNLAGARKVRGIIVANEFTDRLALAAGIVPDLSLKTYSMSFRFGDPS